jgi:hypothetical protein
MTTWTAPRTWVAGETVTAAIMNTHLRDNLTWLKDALTQLNVTSDSAKAQITPALFGARAYHNANQAATSGAFLTVALNSERWDSSAFHDTAVNNSRLTIPASSSGYYLLGANVEWASNASGYRVIEVQQDGATLLLQDRRAPSSSTTMQAMTGIAQINAASYIELLAFQNSGGNLNVNSTGNFSPEFWIHRISST